MPDSPPDIDIAEVDDALPPKLRGNALIFAALILESIIAATSGVKRIVVMFFMVFSWCKWPACADIVLAVFRDD
jgi:hypothetical protein